MSDVSVTFVYTIIWCISKTSSPSTHTHTHTHLHQQYRHQHVLLMRERERERKEAGSVMRHGTEPMKTVYSAITHAP